MRIVLADDHSLFRDGISSLLETAGYQVIAQANDGKEALEAVREYRPDLILLDIQLSGLSGLEVLVLIKAEFPDIKVVMLTVSDADEDLFAAIQGGADGYILKGVKADEFLEMLKGLQRGEAAISRKTAARLMIGFQKLSQPNKTREKMSTRELEILQRMGQGLSNQVIADQLFISPNTVKYHCRNIFQKLGAQNRTEAVAVALRKGLLEDMG